MQMQNLKLHDLKKKNEIKLGVKQRFLDMTPKAQTFKRIFSKLDFIKSKKFYFIKRLKRMKKPQAL